MSTEEKPRLVVNPHLPDEWGVLATADPTQEGAMVLVVRDEASADRINQALEEAERWDALLAAIEHLVPRMATPTTPRTQEG
ncbi:hypothetical protein ACWFMI_23770 [Nocardiopsis terrae]|uniref:hypothetical protein n=1 Tax=Streptomyces sp. NPDC057554 TaxID=3350538 RepID=UPI0036B8D552